MNQTDKDRVGEAIVELASIESPLKFWPRDIKGLIAVMEKSAKDKATPQAERDANNSKRIPAGKTVLKAVENALPVMKKAIDGKLDGYPTAEDYLKSVGATAIVTAEDVAAKMTTFFHTLALGSSTYLKNEAYMRELTSSFTAYKNDVKSANQKLAALRGAPSRPAAAAPARPATPAPAGRAAGKP
jgi:hypothetical protein